MLSGLAWSLVEQLYNCSAADQKVKIYCYQVLVSSKALWRVNDRLSSVSTSSVPDVIAPKLLDRTEVVKIVSDYALISKTLKVLMSHVHDSFAEYTLSIRSSFLHSLSHMMKNKSFNKLSRIIVNSEAT
jgi:hypothetical protein